MDILNKLMDIWGAWRLLEASRLKKMWRRVMREKEYNLLGDTIYFLNTESTNCYSFRYYTGQIFTRLTTRLLLRWVSLSMGSFGYWGLKDFGAKLVDFYPGYIVIQPTRNRPSTFIPNNLSRSAKTRHELIMWPSSIFEIQPDSQW